jgi:hypothetical protein
MISTQADRDIAAKILVDVVKAVHVIVASVPKKFNKLNVIVRTYPLICP